VILSPMSCQAGGDLSTEATDNRGVACCRLAEGFAPHGLAGHFLIKDIPHALKVGIIADMEDRVRLEMTVWKDVSL
jgi:hypothetical protein